ncbi:hypothetical protein Q9251_21755 [Alkalihalobacillus macyae]|uniref:hypothetical protein n=1 Tax=Guptibacillus hwajinpoensis TaxID=208199 RepID=UPI00273AEF42|nr:hypothetical protein [Alkalihalobacillus macyae]MDP4553482.1 hypothetical protein [Alkalihalobacillus macyae]
MKISFWLYIPHTVAQYSAIGGLILRISGSFIMQYSNFIGNKGLEKLKPVWPDI